MGNQVEGYFEKGQKVVVIEDLISTGGSSIKAIDALKDAGIEVKGLIAIFTYGFSAAEKAFKKANCPFLTLTSYDVLIKQALTNEYIQESDLNSLKDWKKSPETWGI